MKTSSEQRALETAKGRCYNRSDKDFPNYGGRGIRVCKRWLNSTEAFLDDMGVKPSRKYSLDRRNTNGPYSPTNCRWATPAQQAQNRRTAKLCATAAVLIRYMSRRGMPQRALAARFGVAKNTIKRICIPNIWLNALDDLSELA